MAESHDDGTGSQRPVIVGIGLVVLAYVGALAMGWPQAARDAIIEAAEHAEHGEEHEAGHGQDAGHETGHEGGPEDHEKGPADETGQAGEEHPGEEGSGHDKPPPPELVWVMPFVLLLGAIAVFPLVPGLDHWWESNFNRFTIAVLLGGVTLLYYLLLHDAAVEGHFPGHYLAEPVSGAPNFEIVGAVLANAILSEYIPFIVLLFSLYTISGGIRIEGDLTAHPTTNSAFILVGGLLASFIGTTGAAMLLIRPLLETNSERRYVQHTVVFFIFVVCNCGGCLLPIGDPPLFLGYLEGVDFLWTMKLAPQWLLVNGMLIAVYFVWDTFFAYPKEAKPDIRRDETQVQRLRFSGLWPNLPLLAGVVVCVALLDPKKPVYGTEWHAPAFLREVVQLGLVALSLALGSGAVRRANRFNYHAILEVAALFVGIFICMQPALQILDVRGGSLGIDSPMKFFWITGSLSSVLDNAPTYLVFFQTAKGVTPPDATAVAGVMETYLVGISLGAVFMGSMTYIGNGPNFMVKAIAEKSGVPMPSFFGYVLRYSIPVLLPVFLIATWISARLGWVLF